jgi:hypothetical protein
MRVDSRQLKIEGSPLPFDALRARKFGADARRAPFRRRHPRATLPRRIVSHVLRVPTLEIGDPIAAIILMERNDLAIRPQRRRGFMQF